MSKQQQIVKSQKKHFPLQPFLIDYRHKISMQNIQRLKYRWWLKFLPIISIILFGCQKKEFTEPVSVELEVKIENKSLDHITFSQGLIMFQQISFNGHRNQGGDVHFSTEMGIEIGPIDFSFTPVPVKRFDIPQGVYNSMQWRFILSDIDKEENDESNLEFDDTDEYPIDEGGILFIGYYRNIEEIQLPLYIVIDEEEHLNCITETEQGLEDITLSSSNSYVAQLVLDPVYALQSISIQSLEEAEISSDDDISFIEISSDMNETLYEQIVFRLISSAKVVVK